MKADKDVDVDGDGDRVVLYWWEDVEPPKVTKEIEQFRQGFIKDKYEIKGMLEKRNFRKGIQNE
jgi:hypothetical protein